MSARVAALLALLWPASPVAFAQEAGAPSGDAAAAAELVDGRDAPQELESYQDTVSRFSDRMGEFEADARAWVRFREAEERASLDENYGALIDELDDDDRVLRATAARRFEAFLDKYPGASHSAHVMFRLAELYFEDAEEDFITADAEFRRAMDSLAEDADLDSIPEEPSKDYRKSARLYRQIIANHPDYQYIDGCYYMLGYVLSQPASVLYDEGKGLEAFRDLVTQYPESQFAAYAHLRIGEYYFDYNQLEAAIPHYRRVVELEGPEGRLYDKGLYKLAWSEYKRSNYDDALGLLNQLLDWSEAYKARTGRDSPMAPEAIEYTAISFSDVADINGQEPIAVAGAFYRTVGEREFEAQVYKRLADVLTQQARYEFAIDVYEFLQKRWPNDPENPEFLWSVARLHASKSPPDPSAVQATIRRLNEEYGEDSNWWRANRNNPDAQAVARGYIEQSLAGVAVNYHDAAIASGQPADFAKAAGYYRQYLNKFPFADDYYELQWYLAETLLRGGDLDAAEKEYSQLLKGGEHNYKEISLWYLRFIAARRVSDTYGKVQTLPPGAEVEKKVAIAGGKERAVYKLGTEHQAMLDASDTLLATDFDAAVRSIDDRLAQTTDKDEVEALKRDRGYIAPIAEGVQKNQHAIAYQSAQILSAHGRYEDARPRLQDIIERFPETDEAAYSARLIVDSYINEEDWAQVRKVSALYAGMPLGQGAGQGIDVGALKDIEQRAALKEVELLVQADKREEAAEAYLQFISDYPSADAEVLKNALYNAANNFERVGRLDDSIRLFKQFVANYPEDDLSKPLYFRLADNYARALELDQAVKYYEALYDVTNGAGKPYGDAPAALFNAGFLRIGMGDYEGAARTFERYERENRQEPDAEQVYFMAAEQWARVSPAREMTFLRKYLADYPTQNPDHVMEARYRIAVMLTDGGKTRDADRAWQALSDAYDAFAPLGKVGPAGRRYASQAKLRDLIAKLDAFKTVADKVKRSETRYAQLLQDRKDELPEIEKEASELVSKYKDFESSSAALYALGTAYLAYADMLYEAPVPKEIAADPDLEMFYFEELDKLRIPLEDKGKARLTAVLETAQAQSAWSEWQTEALALLSTKFPAEYAQEKLELRGMVRDSDVPSTGPRSLPAAESDTPVEEAAPPESGDATPAPGEEAQ